LSNELNQHYVESGASEMSAVGSISLPFGMKQ